MTALAAHPIQRPQAQETAMLDATDHLQGPLAGSFARRRKPVEYKIYFAVIFAVALPIAALGRLLPRDTGYLEASTGASRSVFAEARAIADSIIPFLFMG
ncbi:MAG: cytochrome PufQ [Paracoccaceae bacterium]